MRKSKADFVELLASGAYYVLQKKHDRNLDDIALKREDGLPASMRRGKRAQSSVALSHFRYRFAKALAYKRETARIGVRNRAPISKPPAGRVASFASLPSLH